MTSTTTCAPVSASVKLFSGNRIDALRRRCRNDFVAACTKEVHYFATDEARAAEDDYFHILIFGFRCFVFDNDCVVVARYGCLPKRFSVAERFEPGCFHLSRILWLELFEPMVRCFKVVIG